MWNCYNFCRCTGLYIFTRGKLYWRLYKILFGQEENQTFEEFSIPQATSCINNHSEHQPHALPRALRWFLGLHIHHNPLQLNESLGTTPGTRFWDWSGHSGGRQQRRLRPLCGTGPGRRIGTPVRGKTYTHLSARTYTGWHGCCTTARRYHFTRDEENELTDPTPEGGCAAAAPGSPPAAQPRYLRRPPAPSVRDPGLSSQAEPWPGPAPPSPRAPETSLPPQTGLRRRGSGVSRRAGPGRTRPPEEDRAPAHLRTFSKAPRGRARRRGRRARPALAIGSALATPPAPVRARGAQGMPGAGRKGGSGRAPPCGLWWRRWRRSLVRALRPVWCSSCTPSIRTEEIWGEGGAGGAVQCLSLLVNVSQAGEVE